MDAEKEIERLLSVNNAVLERNRRHLVWRIPGKGVSIACGHWIWNGMDGMEKTAAGNSPPGTVHGST